MKIKDQILDIIFKAINEVNLQLDKDSQIQKSGKTIIYTEGEKLDSLTILNLLVEIEQQVEIFFSKQVILAGESIISESENPLSSVDHLADYIKTLL